MDLTAKPPEPPRGLSRRNFIGALLAGAVVGCGDAQAKALRVSKGPRGTTLTQALTARCYGGTSTTAVTGVGPLYVHFDASATTSTQTARPFHELLYSWDFGDTGAGNYATGTFAGTARASRNASYGPLAGHVYDAPGTYTATCTYYDGINTKTKSITVTVTDGSANEWAGCRTILVSTSGNFTCAGLTNSANAVHHTWVDWPTLNGVMITQMGLSLASAQAAGNNYAAGPLRVLFRTAETFQIASQANANANQIRSSSGPMYMGSYNDAGPCVGANATLQGTNATAGFGILGIGNSTALNFKGFVIQDLTLDGSLITSASSGYGIFHYDQCDWALYRRLTFNQVNHVCIQTSLSYVSQFTSSGRHVWAGSAIVDCVQQNPMNAANNANSLAYTGSQYTYIAGNLAYAGKDAEVANSGSHNVRLQWFDKAVVEHNDFRYPGATQHGLKMHSGEIVAWGRNNGVDGIGPFTASATLQGASLGEYRRPFGYVEAGLWPADTQHPIFECTTGGTTGNSQPAWNTTVGQTTIDNLAVWTCRAYASITPMQLHWRATEGFASTYAVVHSNYFLSPTAPWSLSIGPLDTDDYSKCYDVAVFNNWFDNGHYAGATKRANRAINCQAERCSIYNNVIDLTDAVNGTGGAELIFVGMRQPGALGSSTYAARDVWVYNNTGYLSAATAATIAMVYIDKWAHGVVAKNNALYTPGLAAKSPQAVDVTSSPAVAGQWTSSNNTASPTTDPLLVATPPVLITDWAFQAGSNTKDAGASVPVQRDLYGTARAGTYDIGAFTQ